MGITEKMGGVKAAMAEIEKQFGRGAIMLLGGEGGTRFDEPVSVIPSGSVGVDRALGVGGLPRGRIIEIYGPEASGKTTMALHAIANAQQTGIAAFVDAEHALDPKYAEALGIDLDQLLVSQPDNGEQALEIVETLIRSNAVDLIVIDSVAALVPKAEIEGEMGDAHVGLQARLMSQAMRKLTGHTARSKTTIIFINQTRHKIGVMFGSPETTTGGNALKFYATIRLDIRRIGALKSADEVVGNRVRVKVVKNKVAPPFREAEFDVIYGRGVSIAGELIDIGIDQKLVEKSGSWYALGGVRMGQGKERAREWLEARPTLMAKLRTVVVKDGKLADLGRPDSWDEPATAPSGVTKDVTKDAAKNAA